MVGIPAGDCVAAVPLDAAVFSPPPFAGKDHDGCSSGSAIEPWAQIAAPTQHSLTLVKAAIIGGLLTFGIVLGTSIAWRSAAHSWVGPAASRSP